jgi:hypothetical protein
VTALLIADLPRGHACMEEVRLRQKRLLPLIVRPGTGRRLEVHVTPTPPDFVLYPGSRPEFYYAETQYQGEPFLRS